ncbi:MAG: hypothetical protein M3O84_03980 [Actinomycetota bacterium]|nr:hypothetical protein [Actinomycetota bacterium]
MVTGPSAASARTDGARRFAIGICSGKFVSLRAQERVVATREEVERLPDHGRLDHGAARELPFERLAPEARRARPDPDVRRRRPLGLHPD